MGTVHSTEGEQDSMQNAEKKRCKREEQNSHKVTKMERKEKMEKQCEDL